MKKKILGVIPARLESTRIPRKMLADIDGFPLIYHTWSQAKKAKKLDALVIATDSEEIKAIMESHGAKVLMTSKSHKTGSDRVAEAVKIFDEFVPEIVINVQGDTPLMPPEAIDQLADVLCGDCDAHMATIAVPLKDESGLKDPSVIKVIMDKNNYALYFSRSHMPYPRNFHDKYHTKLGLFGFQAPFLQKYVELPQTPLELAESLEQLRVLEHGFKIKLGIGDYNRLEVNIPEELEKVRDVFRNKNS